MCMYSPQIINFNKRINIIEYFIFNLKTIKITQYNNQFTLHLRYFTIIRIILYNLFACNHTHWLLQVFREMFITLSETCKFPLCWSWFIQSRMRCNSRGLYVLWRLSRYFSKHSITIRKFLDNLTRCRAISNPSYH